MLIWTKSFVNIRPRTIPAAPHLWALR